MLCQEANAAAVQSGQQRAEVSTYPEPIQVSTGQRFATAAGIGYYDKHGQFVLDE